MPHTCLAADLRMRRTDEGLTQAQVAEDTGITRSAIAQYERGECFPALLIFARLAAKLQLNTKGILACLGSSGPCQGPCCTQEGTKPGLAGVASMILAGFLPWMA